jgi:hypothetical protein
MDMTVAHWAGELLLQAAEMGLADKFGDRTCSADDLAREYEMRPRAFARFLRSLAGMGLVQSARSGEYRLTELGEALKTGAPGAARSAVIALVGGMVKPAWAVLDHALKTGEPAFEKAHGMGLFKFLEANPGMAQLFSETMVGFHGREPPAVAEAYDFSGSARLLMSGALRGTCSAISSPVIRDPAECSMTCRMW